MKIALGIVSLEPKGGLQRDCINIAHILRNRGHDVTIFASRPSQPQLQPLDVVVLPIKTRTNHGRDLGFADKFNAATSGHFDRIVGFNKLPGLDILYCADPSIHDKKRTWWARQMPRHSAQLFLEEACFGPSSPTRILLLSQISAASYVRHWRISAEKITVLPAVVDPSRQRRHLRTAQQRESVRRKLGIPLQAMVWLWVGTKPQKKGLDRVIAALQHYADSFLVILGVDEASPEGNRILPHIRRANVGNRVRFLGYRDDVPEVMAAADLLTHPARLEVTGQVILEALTNGLPVITSELCGFAQYVRDADAGILIREPYENSEFDDALRQAMDPSRLASWSRNGMNYGANRLVMTGLEVAANIIEGLATAIVAEEVGLVKEPGATGEMAE